MNRRKHFIRASVLALAAGLILATGASAQYQEGIHFEVIDRPEGADRDGPIEVVEVFSYMCPHCATFEPYVEPWSRKLPEGVSFRRVPVSFNRSWEAFARAYYTAEVMGLLKQTHEALFRALHQERRAIRSMKDLAAFHAEYGIDAGQFEATAKSFPVETKMRMGNASIAKWQVRSTPTLVIDGKYRVSPRRGGTFDEMLQVADWLIARELAARDVRTEAAP